MAPQRRRKGNLSHQTFRLKDSTAVQCGAVSTWNVEIFRMLNNHVTLRPNAAFCVIVQEDVE